MLSILPNDMRAIRLLYLGSALLFAAFIALVIKTGTDQLSTSLDGDKCYSKSLGITVDFDEDKRIHCGWLTLMGIRNYVASVVFFTLVMYQLKCLLTLLGFRR